MSAVLDRAPLPTLFDALAADPVAPVSAPADTSHSAASRSGELTLAAVIAGAWSELTAGRVVACPVCASALAPVHGAQSLPIGGRCSGCGSLLG